VERNGGGVERWWWMSKTVRAVTRHGGGTAARHVGRRISTMVVAPKVEVRVMIC
jgi:hypothetical protein